MGLVQPVAKVVQIKTAIIATTENTSVANRRVIGQNLDLIEVNNRMRHWKAIRTSHFAKFERSNFKARLTPTRSKYRLNELVKVVLQSVN